MKPPVGGRPERVSLNFTNAHLPRGARTADCGRIPASLCGQSSGPDQTLQPAVTDQRGAVRRFRSVGSCLLIFIAVAMASCGGGSSGPTSPTPAPPTSRYPMMIGDWRGTLAVEQVVTPGSGGSTVSVCNETWAITTQVEGRFSGAFQADGVCAQSGTMFGTVSTSGEISGLTFSVFVGSPGETSTCRRVSGERWCLHGYPARHLIDGPDHRAYYVRHRSLNLRQVVQPLDEQTIARRARAGRRARNYRKITGAQRLQALEWHIYRQAWMTTCRVGWTFALAFWTLLGTAGCDRSPTAPTAPAVPLPDLSGRWVGSINITTTGLPTPMAVDLTDRSGTLTGTGGGADCRFFSTCGSFGAYTISGTHDAVRVTLNGQTQHDQPQEPVRTWTLTGTLSSSASRMSGTGSGSEFNPSAWDLARQP